MKKQAKTCLSAFSVNKVFQVSAAFSDRTEKRHSSAKSDKEV